MKKSNALATCQKGRMTVEELSKIELMTGNLDLRGREADDRRFVELMQFLAKMTAAEFGEISQRPSTSIPFTQQNLFI